MVGGGAVLEAIGDVGALVGLPVCGTFAVERQTGRFAARAGRDGQGTPGLLHGGLAVGNYREATVQADVGG